MKDLSVIGMRSFETTNRVGQFYFPKVAAGRPNALKIEIAQYESGYEEFVNLLGVLARLGPIEWLAHTADAYTVTFEDGDDPLVDQIDRGITSPTALFEAEDPRAIEALQIVKVTSDGEAEGLSLPYRRVPQRIEWVDVPVLSQAEAVGRYVGAMHTAIKASHIFVQ